MPKQAISTYDPARQGTPPGTGTQRSRKELLSGSRHVNAEPPDAPADSVMTSEEASYYLWSKYRLRRSPRRLGQLRAGPAGAGPEFHRAGNVPLYRRSKVDEWAQAQLGESFVSTSHEQQTYAEQRHRALAGT